MLELPCSEIPRDAPTRLCLQLISETCTKLQKAETPPCCRATTDQFLLLAFGLLQQRARKGHGKVFSTYVCTTALPVIT